MKNEKLEITSNCIHCGSILMDKWNFCPHCKTKIETIKCANCNSEIKKHWRFCPFCKSERKYILNSQIKNDLKIKYDSTNRVFEQGNDWLKSLLEN